MKEQRFYKTFIYTLSILFIGILLMYPLLSHEAVINNATNSGTSGYKPGIVDADVQCKRLLIDPNSSSAQRFPTTPDNSSLNTPLPDCPIGFVPVGINTGAVIVNSNAATGEKWLRETISEWGDVINSAVWYDPLDYKKGNDAINKVQMICVPRTIEFKPGPCTQ